MTWVVVLVVVLTALLIVVKVLRATGSMEAGDLVRVPIPRSGPLAMGTRLDVAAALKKAGESTTDLSALVEARDDNELLRRYWELKDEEDDS